MNKKNAKIYFPPKNPDDVLFQFLSEFCSYRARYAAGNMCVAASHRHRRHHERYHDRHRHHHDRHHGQPSLPQSYSSVIPFYPAILHTAFYQRRERQLYTELYLHTSADSHHPSI